VEGLAVDTVSTSVSVLLLRLAQTSSHALIRASRSMFSVYAGRST